jgi:hypothetical protein
MKLCFVSLNVPREPYFVDEPRIFCILLILGMSILCRGPNIPYNCSSSAKMEQYGINDSSKSYKIYILYDFQYRAYVNIGLMTNNKSLQTKEQNT